MFFNTQVITKRDKKIKITFRGKDFHLHVKKYESNIFCSPQDTLENAIFVDATATNFCKAFQQQLERARERKLVEESIKAEKERVAAEKTNNVII